MDRQVKILTIDDEETMLRIIRKTLEPEGFFVETFNSAEEGLSHLMEESADIVITDLMMPGTDGFRIIEKATSRDREIKVIVITAFSSIESAVKAMKLGAYDFIPKPFDPEHLLMVVRKAVESRFLRLENIGLKRVLKEKDYLRDIIGISRPIQHVKGLIEKVKETDGNVLLTGESGVGKELVAKAIHYGSKRGIYPFIPINCGALPDNLLESELFGYEKGAFTGAVSQKRGLLEIANGGTVFLDEVGCISQMMQIKLLRFLQDRSFIRLGGNEVVKVDVRIISATNESLVELIKDGIFRKDLYYRLNVIPIDIPPLRERRDDIPLLIRHFIKVFSSRIGKEIKGITREAESLLLRYWWEGNVRELENTIERAITLTDDNMIKPEDISDEIAGARVERSSVSSAYRYDISLLELEIMHIKNVLSQTGGNKSKAARILGIDYSTLLRKLKSFNITV
jgi:DNA-binding NtrC family response regulator